jgi:hypothetical protein
MIMQILDQLLRSWRSQAGLVITFTKLILYQSIEKISEKGRTNCRDSLLKFGRVWLYQDMKCIVDSKNLSAKTCIAE